MVKVVEKYGWEVKVDNVHIRVNIRLIDGVLDLAEIIYCAETCNFMTASSEHPNEYQDMVLNLTSLVLASGKLKKEEYSIRIEYGEEQENV